ncbi:MAG: prephenate dehydrogenase [Actinomycetota bacterium]
MKKVRVIGAGLIGTSIALGLAGKGIAVKMVDSDQARAGLAQDLVGEAFEGPAELVIFALPSSYLSKVIVAEFALNPQATFMDIGSTKTKPQGEIDTLPGLAARFCGTHPMAGREIGGPEGARADLFDGRVWIYTPTAQSQDEVIATVLELIALLNATPIKMDAAGHDAAVALISHLPQISASLLAKQLLRGDESWMALAGQGLKDATRIAASEPSLWQEIISANRGEIRPLLLNLEKDLHQLITSLDESTAIESVIADGRLGRKRIPGKHGGRPRDYHFLPIVIEDKAGQLAALFQECAIAGVNIEDLSIEHSPGQFTGLVTLALSRDDAEKLSKHLLSRGWKVHASS